jgi:signal transduction histidine kinase
MLPDFRVRQRDYLLEISLALTQELDLGKLLGRILDVSIEMTAGQAGLLALREEKGGWRVNASHGIPPAFVRYLETVLANIQEDEDPAKVEIPEINRILKELTHNSSLGLLNGVGLPMVARQQVVGVIFVFRSFPDVFSPNDRMVLNSFANQAAIAVQNARLYSQISAEKQRLDALLDSAADGILIITTDHRIERCNPAFARILSRSVEEILNQPLDHIIRWASPPQGMTLDEAEAGGWPLSPNATLYVEGDLERLSLTNLPIGITYAPLLSPDGSLRNIIATVRDITRFRQADELKSTFISIISHELKTPIALIKGYVATLRRDDAQWDRDVVQDSLAVIEDEADHLTELVENMLDASRLAAGGFKIKKSDVNIPEIAHRLAERFKTQDTNHTIVVDFPPDFPVIMGDETRLSQVISNLINNAIKYSPSGEIRVSGQILPKQVIIGISDQGPGIPSDEIPHLFDRFYRGQDSARKTSGTGLGLYLARSIVEAHGGNIWVDPQPNEGARFFFSLPR